MSHIQLSLFSEPYSPSGNVAADGVRRLLGAPRLDLLQTLVREAVQNSCDAAKNGTGPEVHFRLRRLNSDQRSLLGSSILAELPGHDETSSPVQAFLTFDSPWVLEICDFGTTGLAGPTRADIPAEDGEHTDFVDFIRNIGSQRNTDLGGGTYGYGKSALYLASDCGLIIIDSQTTCAGEPVRRLIGAQLGSAHESSGSGERRRYTGRHWWGALSTEGGYVEPLEGPPAERLAHDLGMPVRDPNRTGTTIMIVAPQFVSDNVEDVIGALQEALLWFFWPRMMEDVPASRRLTVRVELDGALLDTPKPEETAPLDLFCEAMREIRSGAATVQKIESQRPNAFLGSLSIAKGFAGERPRLRTDGESLLPSSCHHIALMRPVELVVRYLEDGHPLPQAGVEWAGVFVTSSEQDVERAFADSEPPAHDDWQPDILPTRSWARRYVRVALSRLKDAAAAVSGGQAAAGTGQREGPSLAHIADLFGKALGSANLQGGAARPAGRPGSATARKPFAVSRPVFERLVSRGRQPVAVFTSHCRNETARPVRLSLEASIVLDGAAAAVDLPGSGHFGIINVLDDAGSSLGAGPVFEIGPYDGNLMIEVSMPAAAAVTVRSSIEAPF